MINYEEQAKILISSEEKQISDQASMTIGKVFQREIDKKLFVHDLIDITYSFL